MRETARAQAMQDFVIGLFDNAGEAQQGNIFDARKLLVAGERRGERELADQPLARAELLGVIARLRIGLGDYQEALALIQRQDALLTRTDSAPAGLRLEAVTLHGRTLRLLDRSKECLQVMAPFESLLLARVQPAQQADFLSQYGRCRRLMGERQTAQHLYERSLALRRELKDETGVAENLYDLALIDNDLGRTDHALAGYDAALRHLRTHVGARNALTVEIETSRGRLFRARGNTGLARDTFSQALSVAEEVHGPQHPVTLTIRRLLVAIQVDQEHYAEAEQQIEPLYRLTINALGPIHRETGMALNTRGVIAFELGRMDKAIADVAEAVRIWRGAAGSQNLHGGLFNYGMILHGAGREDEALKALLESRALRAAQYGASDSSVGEADRMIGEILAGQGKLDQAAVSFDRAVKLTRVGLGAEHPRTLFAQLSMARNQGRMGQSAAALKTLGALAAHPGQDSEIPKLHWSARAYAAEVRCRDGQRDRARRELDALIAELRAARPDGGVITREAVAIRDACR
jgi:serine/threonine-protein kinase